jgi:hypothetical protein
VVPGAQFKHAQLAFENGGLVFQLDPKCVFTGSHTAGHVLPENTTTDSAAIMAAVAVAGSADAAAASQAAALAAVIVPVPVALLSEVVKFEAGPLKEFVAATEKAFNISGVFRITCLNKLIQFTLVGKRFDYSFKKC